jgi:Zn-dependent oligopeptidase
MVIVFINIANMYYYYYYWHNCCCCCCLSDLSGALIIARQKLARLLSFDSFSHKTLSRKVITTPQQVQALLHETARCVSHQANTEGDLLRAVKTSLLELQCATTGGHSFTRKKKNRIYSKGKNSTSKSAMKGGCEDELDSVALSP